MDLCTTNYLTYYLICKQVQNEENNTRLGALQITEIQNLTEEIQDLSDHLNSATKLSQNAIQKDGNFIVQGIPSDSLI